MSATDELRRLLDERGVEYGSGFGGDTFWTGRYGIEWRWDKQEGTLAMYSHTITPEQAIASTLGAGTCRDSNERFNAWQCSECGATLLLMFDDLGEPTFSVDGAADVPSYCPNCGRKVKR